MRQMEAAREWCERNGYTLADEQFVDEGKSGRKGEHLKADGDLKRFLTLVENGRIKPGAVLVLESFDRLSRLPMSDAISLFLQIINAGIGLVFTMTFDKKLITKKTVNNDLSVLYIILGEAQRAFSESQIKSERVKDAYARRKQKAIDNGHKTVAWCPPWCDFKDGEYVPNIERAAIINRIFDEYLKGNGAFRISRLFNKEKVPTLGHRAAKKYKNTTEEWYKKTVRDFLMDTRVYGYWGYLNKENYYPVVVTKEKFLKVQARLKANAQAEPTGGPTELIVNLFKGICRCVHCGSAMSRTTTTKTYKNKKTKYDYFVCEGAKGGMGCSYKSMTYSLLEQTFTMAIAHHASAVMTGRTNNKEPKERLDTLNGEFAMNETKIQRIMKQITDSDDAPKNLVALLKQIEAQQETLTKSIKLAETQLDNIKFLPNNVQEMIDMVREFDGTIDTKEGRLQFREYIHNTISSIVVDTKGVTDGDGNTINYLIRFKNGKTLSVVIYYERQPNQQAITAWQAHVGVVTQFNWRGGVNTKSIPNPDFDKIYEMMERKWKERGLTVDDVQNRNYYSEQMAIVKGIA